MLAKQKNYCYKFIVTKKGVQTMSKLKEIREKRGISQRELERISGIQQQSISLYEKGKPLSKLYVAKRLAQALGCNINDILDFDAIIAPEVKFSTDDVHNYITYTRNLLELTPRRIASFLEISEKEYNDFEDPNTIVTNEQAKTVVAAMYMLYNAKMLGNTLKQPSFSSDISEKEQAVLKEFRSLSAEHQDRFINLIVATPLLK